MKFCSSHRSLEVAVNIKSTKDGFNSTRPPTALVITYMNESTPAHTKSLTQCLVRRRHIVGVVQRLLNSNIHNGHQIHQLVLCLLRACLLVDVSRPATSQQIARSLHTALRVAALPMQLETVSQRLPNHRQSFQRCQTLHTGLDGLQLGYTSN